jgi:hypothetical protein
LHFGRASAIGMLLVGMACAGAVAEEAVRLQRVASTGEAAPGGGVFDRFGAEAAPIVAPVNARGDVAFFATLGRGNSGEGLFRWSRGRVVAVAREGDRAGSVGTFSVSAGTRCRRSATTARWCSLPRSPAAAPSRACSSRATAMSARCARRRAGARQCRRARRIRCAGDQRARRHRLPRRLAARPRDVEAVLIASGGRLRKVVAQGDPAPSGGSFRRVRSADIDRDGAVAFGAAIDGRSVPGGIFIWKADQLRMVLGAGDESPIGGIFAKFSERIGIGDQGTVVFHGQLKGAPAAAGIFAIRDGRVRRSRAWATRPRAAASTRTSDCGQ